MNSCLYFLSFYRRLSTGKQIALGISLVMGLTVLLVSGSLFAQISNIRKHQEQLPSQYLSSVNKKSLLTITKSMRFLILEILNIRRSLLNYLRTAYTNQKTVQISESRIISNSSHNLSQKMQCNFTTFNTIFSCGMHSYPDLLLLKSNIFMQVRPLKRFNIYFLNKKDNNDIMIKSLSRQLIPQINVEKIKQKIQNVKQGEFMFESFYQKGFKQEDSFTSAFRTKINFENYIVLLQAEGYGAFLKRTITRVLYTQNTNILILAKNETDPKGYSLVSNLKQLCPEINYKQLLQSGYYQRELSDGHLLYISSEDFSSVYPIDVPLNSLENRNITVIGNYYLVAYSESTTKSIQQDIYGFIHNLYHQVSKLILLGIAAMAVQTLKLAKLNKRQNQNQVQYNMIWYVIIQGWIDIFVQWLLQQALSHYM